MRRMLPRLAVAAVIMLSASPSAAQDHLASTSLAAQVSPLPNAFERGVLFPVSPTASGAEVAFPTNAPDFSRLRRPALLPALYAANIALQGLDAHSTIKALDGGAREANPLMKGVADNRGALLAVKVGAAASTIFFAEKLWRRNRVAAVVLMVAVNGVSAAVVAHNYRVARRPR